MGTNELSRGKPMRCGRVGGGGGTTRYGLVSYQCGIEILVASKIGIRSGSIYEPRMSDLFV